MRKLGPYTPHCAFTQGEGNEQLQHWVMSKDRIQTIITNLDLNLMTLRAAKNYFSAYGVIVKGSSKNQFIKNLCKHVFYYQKA